MIKDSSQIASQSVEQQLVVKHLNERFNHWKYSVQDVSDLFKQVLGLEKELDKILTSSFKMLDSKDQDFGQSVGNVFMPLKDYLLHRHASIESLHGQFDVQIIKRLKQLKTQLQAKSAEFTKAMAKAQSIVDSARLNAKKEITRYEKDDVIRKRNSNISPVPSHLQMDPWLDTKLVWEKINVLVAEEATYQDTMSLIFKEIGLYDVQIAQELHAILVQHNLLKKQELNDLLLHVKPESSLNLDLFENFAVAHGLKNGALWNIRVQADDFKFDAPQIKVYKQSIVYRRSVIGLGWEPVLLVLTESGYLHQFEMKKDKSVVKHYKKQESERDLLSGTLHKSRETSEMDQTVLDETHKPSLSISLAQPRITILPTPKKNDNFAFEITLLKRKEGITKFLSKEKDAVNTQYPIFTSEYKCLSEADMVEWIAFLQKTVNRLFPQNPPKPLFKSTDKIEETVEEMIKQQSVVRGHSPELKGGEAEMDSIVGKEEPNKKATERMESSATMAENTQQSQGGIIVPAVVSAT